MLIHVISTELTVMNLKCACCSTNEPPRLVTWTAWVFKVCRGAGVRPSNANLHFQVSTLFLREFRVKIVTKHLVGCNGERAYCKNYRFVEYSLMALWDFVMVGQEFPGGLTPRAYLVSAGFTACLWPGTFHRQAPA